MAFVSVARGDEARWVGVMRRTVEGCRAMDSRVGQWDAGQSLWYSRPPVSATNIVLRCISAVVAVPAWLALLCWCFVTMLVLGTAITQQAAIAWAVATPASIMLAGSFGWRCGLLALGLVLGLTGSAVLWTNWAIVAPKQFFTLHRGDFDEIARLTEAHALPGLKRYSGADLPVDVADASINGKAAIITGEGSGGNVKLVFVPAWFGIPDDAGGYLYLDEPPPTDLQVSFNLYGRGGNLADAQALGGGWWVLL